ncbi:unnamed protein product [Scytosiphon promiscuus]
MPFSLAENLPFLALPVALITLKITYDVLPLAAFLALVALVVGCYMFYAGNKSPAAQRTLGTKSCTSTRYRVRGPTGPSSLAKEEAARKQAAKEKKAAAKQKQEAARKAAAAAKEAAAAKRIAQQEAESKPRSAPQQPTSGKSKKQSKKQAKAAAPVEESDSDEDDDFLLRMAELQRAR